MKLCWHIIGILVQHSNQQKETFDHIQESIINFKLVLQYVHTEIVYWDSRSRAHSPKETGYHTGLVQEEMACKQSKS